MASIDPLSVRDVDAVIFDFDGVLVQSVDIKARAFARMFEPYGPDIVRQVVAHHRREGGISRFEKFRHYYAEFLGQPLGEDELAARCTEFAALVKDEVVNAPFVPGAERFVVECSRAVPCFVVSGTPEQEIREIIQRRRMAPSFREIRGAPAGKTENVRALLDAYRLSPGRVIVFGDAVADWQAAADNRTVFVGVVSGSESPLANRQGFSKIANFEDLHFEGPANP